MITHNIQYEHPGERPKDTFVLYNSTIVDSVCAGTKSEWHGRWFVGGRETGLCPKRTKPPGHAPITAAPANIVSDENMNVKTKNLVISLFKKGLLCAFACSLSCFTFSKIR